MATANTWNRKANRAEAGGGASDVRPPTSKPPGGLEFKRTFCPEGINPYKTVKWVERTAEIKDFETGVTTFRQEGCRFPSTWSDTAVNVVAQKYFYGDQYKPERETGVDQVIHRVADQIADWGLGDGYFATASDAEAFKDDLAWLVLYQYGAFNSPVWFNVGLSPAYGVKGPANGYRVVAWPVREAASDAQWSVVPCEDAYEHPQGSACFIQSVDDDLGSIMDLAKSEAMLFKYGSGTGSDLSKLRSSREKLSGGGKPSGPVSFFSMFDAVAKIIKSGGKTRRAARMQTLKDHHPDIMEFIRCKPAEEVKARDLIAAGHSDHYDDHDGAYGSVRYQSTNVSVRLSDAFLNASERGELWQTRAVADGRSDGMPEYDAGRMMDEVARGTWLCGDPGVQYEDTIQLWHTCPNTAPINSSNPCAEYNFIDDSACNLASLNLIRFRGPDGEFDSHRFRAAVRTFIVAQEIIVGRASYPTAKIAENSYRFRPLGLGPCNLGSLVMTAGLPYDSDGARTIAAAVVALMHAEAYRTSAEIATIKGAFDGFAENREPMLKVAKMHQAAVDAIAAPVGSEWDRVSSLAAHVWIEALGMAASSGFRNSQVTVAAPTGTIAFMMDADCTGIEPELGLVKYKTLAGGGSLKIVNRAVAETLRKLGYFSDQVASLVDHVERTGSIEGPYSLGQEGLRPEHLPVFDCAFMAPNGSRSIAWQGHVRMMAAIQPHLSGASSKTINMPASSSVEDIRGAYMLAWRLGIKAVAIFRDGSKGSQPVTTKSDAKATEAAVPSAPAPPVMPSLDDFPAPPRRRLPDTRRATTHKFTIDGHEGYLTVGFFPDGRLGELFVKMAKEGSTVGGFVDAWATTVSLGLQSGIPIEAYIAKFRGGRFEPSGWTENPEIRQASSVLDYICRWIEIEKAKEAAIVEVPVIEPAPVVAIQPAVPAAISPKLTGTGNVSRCCGAPTKPAGKCEVCTNCGDSNGCS